MATVLDLFVLDPAQAGDSAAAYGLYQRRGNLGNGECAACVRDALAQLNHAYVGAPWRSSTRCVLYMASLQLEGC